MLSGGASGPDARGGHLRPRGMPDQPSACRSVGRPKRGTTATIRALPKVRFVAWQACPCSTGPIDSAANPSRAIASTNPSSLAVGAECPYEELALIVRIAMSLPVRGARRQLGHRGYAGVPPCSCRRVLYTRTDLLTVWHRAPGDLLSSRRGCAGRGPWDARQRRPLPTGMSTTPRGER